jgi:hypothetical protein
VRTKAIETLDNVSQNEYVQALIAALTIRSSNSTDDDVDDETGAIDWLIHQLALEQSNVLVRRQAHQGLSGMLSIMGPPSVESKTLVEMLSTPGPDQRLRLLGIIERLLKPMANRAWVNRIMGVANLLPLLQDPDQPIRVDVFNIVQLLLKMGGTASPHETLRLLGPYYTSDYVDVRFAIVACINELATESANHSLLLDAMVVEHLVALLPDENADICCIASTALEKLSSVNDEYAMRVSTSVAFANMTLRNDPMESLALVELMQMVQEEERLERVSRDMVAF